MRTHQLHPLVHPGAGGKPGRCDRRVLQHHLQERKARAVPKAKNAVERTRGSVYENTRKQGKGTTLSQ